MVNATGSQALQLLCCREKDTAGLEHQQGSLSSTSTKGGLPAKALENLVEGVEVVWGTHGLWPDDMTGTECALLGRTWSRLLCASCLARVFCSMWQTVTALIASRTHVDRSTKVN